MSKFSAKRTTRSECSDRDGVARHRNLMCDIALKKQINQIQREGKLLEREMREIRKVKETLKQLRRPVNQRLKAAEDDPYCITIENRFEKEEIKAATNLIGRRSIVPGLPQNTEEKQKKTSSRNRTSCNKNVSFACEKATVCASLPSTSTTQIVKSEDPRFAELSPTVAAQKAKPSIIQVAAFSETFKEGSGAKTTTSIQSSELSQNTARPSTSFLPSVESPVVVRRTCKSSLAVDTDEEITLTMEETLRIKGKFRQIGHSVIAAALLKGLKQRNNLTSEAIHNLHQTVSVKVPEQSKEKEKKEAVSDEECVEKCVEEKPTNKFRKAVHKTITINRVISAAGLTRRRSSSDSVVYESKTPEIKQSNSVVNLNSRSEASLLVASSHRNHPKSLMNTSASRTRQWRKQAGALRALTAFKSSAQNEESGSKKESNTDEDFVSQASNAKVMDCKRELSEKDRGSAKSKILPKKDRGSVKSKKVLRFNLVQNAWK